MICPSCQREVGVSEQNYGALYTCDHCQAVYFINFEGQPEYGEVPAEMPEGFAADSAAAVSAPAEIPAAGSWEIPGAIPAGEILPDPASPDMSGEFSQDPFAGSLEPLVDSVNVVSVDTGPLEAGVADEFLTAPAPEPADAGSEFRAEDNIDFNAGFNAEEPGAGFVSGDGAGQPAPEEPTPAGPMDFAGIAKELSDFGNTDVQLAGLNYDLRISGLDTQETVRLFREAVEDSRFGWDATELLKTVRHGRVELLKLSPVKAYILAKRLQFLDIEKEWKQNALS